MNPPATRERQSKAPMFALAIALSVLFAARDGMSQSPAATPTASGSPSLVVSGEVEHPQTFTADTLAALPRRSVSVTDEKGVAASYEGVDVAEILKRAGAPLGKLRGKLLTRYVLASAPDGYQVLYALAEFDSDFSERVVLLADRRDGHALDAKEGPLRIVLPGDKRHARWIRGVTSLDVRSASH